MNTAPSSVQAALPWRSLWIFAGVYALAWTLLPAWLGSSFALDVVESLSWGKEWEWGYYKHPPLAPWVLNAFYLALGKYGPYLLSQLCIGLTLWGVWCTGRRLMDQPRTLLGTVLTLGVTYYNFPAVEFNHNIAQMPLWAWLGYCFVAALQTQHWRHWVALGVLAGAGLLTKYSVAILLLAMGLYVLAASSHRHVLRTPGPWLAIALMVLVFSPHALWLLEVQGLPFEYARGRAVSDGGNPRVQALKFPVTQLLAHVPLLLVWGISAWRARKEGEPEGTAAAAPRCPVHGHIEQPGLLLAIALLPCLLVTLLGMVMGMRLRDMWGSPMWAFSGLLCMAWVPAAWATRMLPKVLRGIGIWLVLVSSFMVVYLGWGADIRKRAARMDWPGVQMGQQARSVWAAHSHCGLDTVAGHYWLAGLISAYAPDRPSVLIEDDARFSPWASAERLQHRGALWVWQTPESSHSNALVPPEPLASVDAATHGLTVHEGQWQIPWRHAPDGKALTVHWRAYVPAACVRP